MRGVGKTVLLKVRDTIIAPFGAIFCCEGVFENTRMARRDSLDDIAMT